MAINTYTVILGRSSGEVLHDTVLGTSTSLRKTEVSETGGESAAILQYFSEITMTA